MVRADKREAIMHAAMKLFGQVGYLVASIDAIATEANVSTRTIYNHFENKERLFAEALLASSSQVAQRHEELIRQHLDHVTDLEAALIALAKDWARPMPEFDDHYRLSGRMNAEREHFPVEVYAAWREAGPWRVQRTLAARFDELREQGMLDMPDSKFAAHLLSVMLKESNQIEKVVRAFLYGYVPRRTGG